MSRPWMPLYVGDFLADTMHLGATERGIYISLLMHCWQHGTVPRDDRMLARISGCDSRLWHQYRETVLQFFDVVDASTMQHKRVTSELHRCAEISSKRKAAAKQKQSNCIAKAEQLHTHTRASSPSHPHIDSEPNGSADVVGEDPKAALFRIGKTVLVSFGVTEKRTGALIGQWLKARPDPVGLLAAIQYARNQNVAEPVAYISTLVNPKGESNGHRKQSLSELALDLADQVREREREAGIERSPDIVGSAEHRQ